MNHVTDQPIVRIERTLSAPRSQVYRAWLSPELIRRWMAPGYEVTRVEVDERVGGRYRVFHADAGVPAGGFEAEILELAPPERIAWRWGFAGPERENGPVYDSLLTVTLCEAPGGGTVLTLVHERLDDLAAALPHVAGQVSAGWDFVLSKLAAVLATDA
ncbi:MAG: SRPBCC domain-containing protein [Trebonia sp.]|jgi:uncharacterized protein YndB with AHSA1/START domain